MKKIGAFLVCFLAATVLLSAVQSKSAQARSTYARAFLKLYVGDEETKAEKKLAKEIDRVKRCNVCHDPRPDENDRVSKKNRNPYGQELAKYMTPEDKRDVEKATKMLIKIEKSKLKDMKVPFGKLIEAGKLPFEYDAEVYK